MTTPARPVGSTASLTPELLLETFSEPITCHRAFVPLAGTLSAAIILTYACYAKERLPQRKGMFVKDRSEWLEETGLSQFEFEAGVRKLRSMDLLTGHPSANGPMWRLNEVKLYQLLDEQAGANWGRN